MIQELIDRYEQRLGAYIKQIEEHCSKRSNTPSPVSPSYLKEVLIPVFEALKKAMPRGYGGVKIPNPATYYPIKEYYRIKVGLTTIGGFLVPDGNSFDLFFVPLKNANPIGERVRVESIEQLCDLIIGQFNKK
ncbi:MAG: hypothetical protein SNI91_02790 [Rikenellaceae bacterium]